jgi:protein phosphatase
MDGRDIDPDYSVRQVLPGDRYLLCSDGLSGVVSADTIADTLREYPDQQQCVERLVQLALRGGGPDNITVIVADASDEDIVEETPVVGGAAARDRGMATAADESTPAARASALAAPRAAAPDGSVPQLVRVGGGDDDNQERPRRHPLRASLLALLLLVLLAGGLWFGWDWTQRQYYVGVTEDGQVAIFRGVPGQIAGLRLSSVHQTSDTRLEDLTGVAQDTVRQGIEAESEADARAKLAELTNNDANLIPLCSPSPSPSSSESLTVSPLPTLGTGTPVTTGSPTPEPSVTSASTTPSPTPTCRDN